MTGRLNFKLAALGAILSAMLVAPALGQQPKGEMGQRLKERRIEMIKGLKLAPEKEKAIMAVGDKYTAQRKGIIEALKKAHADLQAALAAPKPDEAKIKELVTALTSGQDALFNSFKSQRDEELALMSPVEQGKYLTELGKWRHQMMEKGKAKAPKAKK